MKKRRPLVIIASILCLVALSVFFTSRPQKGGLSSSSDKLGGDPASGLTVRASARDSATRRDSPLASLPDSRNAPTFTGSSGKLKSKQKNVSLILDEGLFERVFIEIDEPIELSLNLRSLKPGKPVFVTATEGGRLERKDGPLEFTPTSSTQKLDLDFTPSSGRGVYNIHILHGGESMIIDLWAGEINPLGKPGEKYVAPEFPVEVP